MGKKTTKSWDKRQERKLRSYLRANGYLYVCSKGGHDKYRSQITGNNIEVNNHINKMVRWPKVKRLQLRSIWACSVVFFYWKILKTEYWMPQGKLKIIIYENFGG